MTKGVVNQVIVAMTATLGAMAMGTILGWSSPAQIMLPEVANFNVTEDDAQTYGSVFGLGAVIGALPAGKLSNIIGRRYAMVLFEMFVVAGWVSLTIPKGVWMLNVGRVLQGVGVGALCTVIPAYVGEISEPNIRGSLGALFQVYVVIGILLSYVFGSISTYVVFNVLCGIWAVIHLVVVLFIPESPHYLLSNNKDDAAKNAMMKLRDDEAGVVKELATLKSEIDAQKNDQHSFLQVFSNKVNRKALLIGIGCMFFQQTSGINVIIFYMSYIFKVTHSSISPDTSSITVGVVQLIMTFVTMAIIDKAGRRVLLIISAVLMGLSFACLGGCFFVINKGDNVSNIIVDWLPLVSIAVYISAFSIGFGPVPWVVMGEIFSNEVKPYGTSLATATNWILVFAVTYLPQKIIKIINMHGLFFVYTGFCLGGALFVWLVIPETKNKTLAEIQTGLAAGRTNEP